jgi:hypothetical protein
MGKVCILEGGIVMSENLPEAIDYHGYQIKPTPMKVIIGDAEKWNSRFEIWEYKGDESTVFPFYGKPTWESKEEAIKHCFHTGKHIIDNEPEKLVKKQ